jgi:hypothetical protein
MLIVIALLSMIVDHVGILFFDNNIYFRILGRIAFPVYAYLIVVGLSRTSDKTKYLYRLFVLAIVSQLPFYLMGFSGLNVIFLFVIYVLVCRDFRYSFLILFVPFCDYGLYGFVLMLVFSAAEASGPRGERERAALLALSIVGVSFIHCALMGDYFQLCAVVSIPVLVCVRDNILRLPRLVKYAFYPVHMIILVGIRELIYFSLIVGG